MSTPAPQEKKSSLEDLVGQFINESRSRTNKIENMLDTVSSTVNSHMGLPLKTWKFKLVKLHLP